ncbi:MAG: hypothetical protein RIS64_3246 [Bacteroidota bacterium]
MWKFVQSVAIFNKINPFFCIRQYPKKGNFQQFIKKRCTIFNIPLILLLFINLLSPISMNKPIHKLIATIALVTWSNLTFGQQIPLFTQYREMSGVINPAAIGSDFFTKQHNVSFGVSYRRQWVDVQNPPTTQLLHGEWFNKDHTGVGLIAGGHLINDQTGPTGFTGGYGRVGVLFGSDPETFGWSVGLNAGMVQYRIKTSELKLHDPDDIRTAQDRMQLYPDLGVGAFFYQRVLRGSLRNDYFYGGISVPQIMGLDLSFAKGDGEFYTQRIQHAYAMTGWYHFLNTESFIETAIWAKYSPAIPINVDLNVRYQMNSYFWIGAGSTARGNKIHAETGFVLGDWDNHCKLGYGFDYSFASFGPFVGATHELNISYSF